MAVVLAVHDNPFTPHRILKKRPTLAVASCILSYNSDMSVKVEL